MTGYIYAIACADRIKIGYSQKPELRYNKIASDAPYPCELLGYWPGTRIDEENIHSIIEDDRQNGEWFRKSEAVQALLRVSIKIRPYSKSIARRDRHLDPARTIIAFLGGVHRVREITGSHISNIYRWMMPREKRGTGGKVPYETADQLLGYAKENGIDLRGDDFFNATRLQQVLGEEKAA